jgi:translocation and assembly module TamB
LRVNLRGEELRYRDRSAQSLTLDADVDLSGTKPSTLALRVAALRAAGGRWDLDLDGGGRPRAHQIEISLRGDGRSADLTLAGDWRAPDWRGRLIGARIAPGVGPVWSLAGPADLNYTDGAARLDRACLTAGDAHACLAADATPGRANGRFEFDALPLALAGILLSPDVAIDGTLSAAGDFGYADGMPRLNLEFGTSAIAVHVARIDGEDVLLGAAPGGGRLRLAPEGGELAFDFELRPAGRLSADVILGPGATLAERALDGEIVVAMPDLAPFAVLSPELDELSGRLDGGLRLGGRLGAPSLDGALVLSDGRAVLPRPGLTLSEMELRLAGEGGRLVLTGGARSGDGRLALSGRLRPAPPPDLELQVTGEDFQILNTRDARVAVSPELELTLAGRRAEVRGSVDVPSARITPREIGATGAMPVSRDQVIVHDGEVSEPPLAVDAEIRLTLGGDVRVEASGLKANLGGAITLRQRPHRLATATGELETLEGEYRAYGQGLKIETGKLLYTGGPVDNPGLDVRAVRRPREDVTVGVTVRGSLREPDFRLFSEPAMSQTRQLSWLVLGRPLEQTSGGESSALAEAAIGLGLKSGDFLGRRVQDTLGLDTLGVESEAGGPRDRAAFVIGKYLSPKLYVSYGIGLLEPVNVLKLRYEISRRWTLLTESGTESGGDITYSIER